MDTFSARKDEIVHEPTQLFVLFRTALVKSRSDKPNSQIQPHPLGGVSFKDGQTRRKTLRRHPLYTVTVIPTSVFPGPCLFVRIGQPPAEPPPRSSNPFSNIDHFEPLRLKFRGENFREGSFFGLQHIHAEKPVVSICIRFRRGGHPRVAVYSLGWE